MIPGNPVPVRVPVFSPSTGVCHSRAEVRRRLCVRHSPLGGVCGRDAGTCKPAVAPSGAAANTPAASCEAAVRKAALLSGCSRSSSASSSPSLKQHGQRCWTRLNDTVLPHLCCELRAAVRMASCTLIFQTRCMRSCCIRCLIIIQPMWWKPLCIPGPNESAGIWTTVPLKRLRAQHRTQKDFGYSEGRRQLNCVPGTLQCILLSVEPCWASSPR